MNQNIAIASNTRSISIGSVSPEAVIIPVRAKNPALMAALSLLVPGLGQMGCAQDNKGIFLMGMALLGYWLTGGTATLILRLLSTLDAFVVARSIQRGSLFRKWDFFPGVKPFEKLPERTIPLIIALLIFALMTLHIVLFAQGR